MKYKTIVADPPWPYGKSGAYSWRRSRPSGEARPLPYQTMPVDEIAALRVSELSENDAHLYLWTTNRFILDGYRIAKAWGFEPRQILTWVKPPTGWGMGGAFANSTEFVIFARRGRLPYKTRINRDWWQWSRGEHSAKPEAFQDIVESVSPGPYIELFARRNRLGWATWGNESLCQVQL